MKALVLFSGGLDSTVLAAQLQADGIETRLLSIDYGQRHAKELDKAEKIAQALGLPHRILRLPDLGPLLGGSSHRRPSGTARRPLCRGIDEGNGGAQPQYDPAGPRRRPCSFHRV